MKASSLSHPFLSERLFRDRLADESPWAQAAARTTGCGHPDNRYCQTGIAGAGQKVVGIDCPAVGARQLRQESRDPTIRTGGAPAPKPLAGTRQSAFVLVAVRVPSNCTLVQSGDHLYCGCGSSIAMTVRGLPPRTSFSLMKAPGRFSPSSVRNWPLVVIASPSSSTTISPFSIPAFAAADSGLTCDTRAPSPVCVCICFTSAGDRSLTSSPSAPRDTLPPSISCCATEFAT